MIKVCAIFSLTKGKAFRWTIACSCHRIYDKTEDKEVEEDLQRMFLLMSSEITLF